LKDKTARGIVLSPAVVIWGLQFLTGLASAPSAALLAVYMEKVLHESLSFTASLKSIQLVLGGLAAPLAGHLADRLGYKRAYVWGMTSTVAACAVFLTGQPLLLVMLFLYSGSVGSLQTISGQAYLMYAAGRARLGRASAGFFLGMNLGQALGSYLSGKQAKGHGFALMGATCTLLAAALIAVGAWGLPSLKKEDRIAARPARRRDDEEGEPKGGNARTSSGAPANDATARTPLSVLLMRREVQLLLGIRFLPTCSWGVVSLLVPLLLFRLTGSPETAGAYGGVSLAFASACQILTGRACDRNGLRLPLVLTPLGIIISVVGLTLGAHSVPALWVFGVFGTGAAWSLSTTMPSLIDDCSRPGEKGRMVGLTAFAWSAGMLTGTQVAGQLDGSRLVLAHPGLPFALATLCCLGTLALAGGLVRSTVLSGPEVAAERH
jgi:MFS family permease